MQYTVEMTIDLPRERVIELFDDPDNLPKWQEGLQSFEHIDGELGKPGGRSRLTYDMGNRVVKMIETIETRSLPDEFTALYEADNVWNRVANRFHEHGEGQTLWQIETEFRFTGLMRLFALFMRKAFPKQTLETMESFVAFAEKQDIA